MLQRFNLPHPIRNPLFLFKTHKLTPLLPPRPRKHAHNAPNLAKRRLLPPRAIPRRFRKIHASHQSQDPRAPRKDGSVFPVSHPYCPHFQTLAFKSMRDCPLIFFLVTLAIRPEDSEIEVANMKPGVGELDVFPSIWGHWAGGPGDSKEDLEWLDGKLKAFFAGK